MDTIPPLHRDLRPTLRPHVASPRCDPLHHCATGAVLAVGLSFVIALTSLLVSMILLSCREEWPGSLSATAVAMPLVVGALLIFLLTIVVCVQSCEAWMNVSDTP